MSLMKKALAIFCFLLLCFNIKAESVFSLDLKTDIILSTLAAGLFVSSLFIENPPNQIPDSLNRSDVNPFDRFFMVTRRNQDIRFASDIMIAGISLLPVISVEDNFNANRLLTYTVMYSQTLLLAHGIEGLMKNNITRFRPYLHDGGDLSLRTDIRHESFPSGHTCTAFLSATFFATTFSMENPDSRWKWPVIIGSYTLATGVGAMRMMAGMHFFTDVLAGAALGSLFGWLVPYLHRNDNSNNFPVIITGNGLLVSLKF